MTHPTERYDPSRDDYLWNSAGEPDAFVSRLEDILEPAGKGAAVNPARPAESRRLVWLAAAAAVVVAAVAVYFAAPRRSTSGLIIASQQGNVRVDDSLIHNNRLLGAGQRIATESRSTATVHRDASLLLTLREDSSLLLKSVEPTGVIAVLERGGVYTAGGEPDGVRVELPGGTVAYGGAPFFAAIDHRGGAIVETKRGSVTLAANGSQTRLAHGAMCRVDPDRGPGIPVVSASPAAGLIGKLDAALALGGKSADVELLLTATLERSTTLDAVSLWNLIGRTPREQRVRIVERLTSLVPPPAGITRAALIDGDAPTLEAWWLEIERLP